jgi:excisionase family DNA binding protein
MDNGTNGNGKKWLSPREAADYLGVTLQTLYQWRSANRGPKSYKLGEKNPDALNDSRPVRYRRKDLDRWIMGQEGGDEQ